MVKQKQFFPPVPKTPQPTAAKSQESPGDEQVVAEEIEKVIEQHLAPLQRISFQDLPLNRIRPNPFQARREFTDEDLEELAESIRQHGFISVLLVRPDAQEGYFQLAYGERRWRAAQRVTGMEAVPCRVVAYTDEQMEDIGMVENLQRKDLNPLEEAIALRKMLQRVDPKTGKPFSIRSLALHLGVKKHRVEEPVRLCDIPEDVQTMVQQRADTVRVAFEIAKLPSPEQRQPLISLVLQREANTREVMYLVEQYLAQQRQVELVQKQEPLPTRPHDEGASISSSEAIQRSISPSLESDPGQGQVSEEANRSLSAGVPPEDRDPEAAPSGADQVLSSQNFLPASYNAALLGQQAKLRQDVRTIKAILTRWSEWIEAGEMEAAASSYPKIDVSYNLSVWIQDMQKLCALLEKKP